MAAEVAAAAETKPDQAIAVESSAAIYILYSDNINSSSESPWTEETFVCDDEILIWYKIGFPGRAPLVKMCLYKVYCISNERPT